MDKLHIQDSSNCCRHKLKQPISQNFYSHFWRVFDIWPICVLDAYFVYSPHESGSYSLSILSSTGLEFSQVPVSEAAKLRHYHHATDTAAVALTTAVNGSIEF